MAIIVKEIKLETTSQNLIQAVIAKQNDCNSRYLKVSLFAEGNRIPLKSSSTVTINAERKDGNSKSFYGEVNDDDTATVPLHSWMLELDGTVKCDVSIIDTEGRKLTTTTFVVMVERAACSSEDITTDPEYDVLITLIDEVNDLKKDIAAVDYSLVANTFKGIAIVLDSDPASGSGSRITIDDFSPFPQELKIECTRDVGGAHLVVYDGDKIVAEIHNTGGNRNEDGYLVFPVDGKPLSFEAIAGDFKIEYNKDTNKAIKVKYADKGDFSIVKEAVLADDMQSLSSLSGLEPYALSLAETLWNNPNYYCFYENENLGLGVKEGNTVTFMGSEHTVKISLNYEEDPTYGVVVSGLFVTEGPVDYTDGWSISAREPVQKLVDVNTIEIGKTLDVDYADGVLKISADSLSEQLDSVNTALGDIESALDSILDIQYSLIGGDSV